MNINLNDIVALCKRRGFIYPSSDIYGGLASSWDYGPLGVELKRNLSSLWYKEMTRIQDNIIGFDSSIFMHNKVWSASGHIDNFTDPLVDCKECKNRFRADKIDLNAPCPECGKKNSFTEPRDFNLMFKTNLGAVVNDNSIVYLRPETAQGMYVNFKNIIDTTRIKLPFGIAQIGKAFRNEITTKNFIFRTCEFEQMEMQFFINPKDEIYWFNYWKDQRINYYEKLGIKKDNLRFHKHEGNELAHYARDAYDIEYNFPFGWQELEGIHNRGDFDLKRHQEFSNKKLTYKEDQEFIPYIIETSVGLNRTLLMTLCDAYNIEKVNKEDRTVLNFHPNIAPVLIAVLPLFKKDGLKELAHKIYKDLKINLDYNVDYDESAAIGKRYRRQDEIGTPYCLTVDYQSKEDNTVTLRYRDDMSQKRININEIKEIIINEIKNYVKT